MGLSVRTRLAVLAGRAVSEVSRRAGTGEGSAVGGRVTLALEPHALDLLATGHDVALVSGTNGKTTTTRLLAAALATRAAVTTNSAGANLLSGLVGTLSGSEPGTQAAFEVDEGLLAKVIEATRPAAVTLLNLSRDQLDRIGEVRLHAESWRRALATAPGATVVANVDDPLVAWAARSAPRVTWVGTGQRWRSDAAACPACGARVVWDAGDASVPDHAAWSCASCDFARPRPDLWLEGDDLVLGEGRRVPISLQLPGWCNLANAAMATATAMGLGVDPEAAVRAMAEVGTVAGRYEVVGVDGGKVRLLLAKNPAGWAETLELIRPAPLPVVVGINARVADGRDPSWLWDVPFEDLRGRLVVATGERGLDLAVRLGYADVDHRFVADYRAAVGAAGATDVDLAANYTSFQDARRAFAGNAVDRDAPARATPTATPTTATVPPMPARTHSARHGAVTIGVLFPELLGTYGDGGNAVVLAQRLRWRGVGADVVEVGVGEPVPGSCDIYLMGGGEDGPQSLAAHELRAGGVLPRAVDGGAVVLAVCAGYQLLGRDFLGPDGSPYAGLGLLDCVTTRGQGPRRVGELVVEADAGLGLPSLTGYENHAGVTTLGPTAQPLGRVVVGHGNDAGQGTEGVIAGRVVGTYLHGPVLARNPGLADLMLSWVVGDLGPVDDREVEALRVERIAAARRSRSAAGRGSFRRAR